jgi:HK97 family phage major capsid protein
MTIDELRARQDEIKSRLQALDSEFAGREMTSEARSEWDRIEEEFETNSKTLTELEFRRSRVEELAGSPEHREEPAIHTRRPGAVRGDEIWDLSTIRSSISGPEEATRELKERAKHALERAEFPHEDANHEDTQAHIERLMSRKDGVTGEVSRRIMQTGSPTYRRAFQKKITGQELSPEEQRAMSLVGEDGGFALPYTLDPTFNLTSNGVENPVRQLADVKSITTNTWKGVNTAGTTANYDGESDEVADGSFKLSQPEIHAHRCSVFVPFSYEYGQDFGSLETELATVTQDAKDTKEASAFLTGTGEKQPYGLLVGATNTKSTATKEVLAVADLYTLKGALPPRYVPGASWLANDAQYDRVRQFDDEGGADLWVQLGDGRPANLIGKPAYEWSTMDATTAGNKLIMVYGDIRRCYVIVERIGMAVKIIPDLFGENQRPTGESGFYAFWRNGAKVRDANAARVLKVTAE